MLRRLGFLAVCGVMITAAVPAVGQVGNTTSPADGHTIHVTAPHVVAGKVMGPYHHYCKVLSPEPVIECLCYSSSDPGARLEQVEYIFAKSITRTGAVSLADCVPITVFGMKMLEGAKVTGSGVLFLALTWMKCATEGTPAEFIKNIM